MVCRFWFCVLGCFRHGGSGLFARVLVGVLFRFGFGGRFGAGYDDYVLVFASVGVTSVGVGWFGYKGCDMLVLWVGLFVYALGGFADVGLIGYFLGWFSLVLRGLQVVGFGCTCC